MNLVEQLREAWKTSSENSLLIKKSADRIEQLEAEVLEQCRLNSMGSEREAALLGRIEQLERKLQAAEVCYKDALDRLQGVRNAALEEAAKVCAEQWMIDGTETASEFASVIRELKDQPCTDHQ